MPLSPEDRLAIAETIARYCHATDAGDGAGVAAAFAEDGILEIEGAWQARGSKQIAEIGSFPNKPKHWVNSIVIEGTGSTATSTVYYAAIRGTGPLLATGRYDSTLTKQLNGEWKLVHHKYTGDPPPTAAPSPAQPDADDRLTAADKLDLMELTASFNVAMHRRDPELLAGIFTDDAPLHWDHRVARDPDARAAVVAETVPEGARCWTTNYVFDGTPARTTIRSYFALLQGDNVAETGHYEMVAEKEGDRWRLIEHYFIPDQE